MAASPKYNLASPLVDATFTMHVPEGVSVLSFSASPKLASVPTFDEATRTLTWDLGVPIRPGKSVMLAVKLRPTACTTPSALALDGQLAFTDATGPKTANTCLKRPLYVSTQGCPAIPKAAHGSGGAGGKPGAGYSTCTCNLCQCTKGKNCVCHEQGCACTAVAASV